jgi:alkanesulfonate monooxygenase SsuD/methylene tetrahydromethanopterin reductase-like flavin-dependent oxidoreductase (luciferase family)
MRVFHFSEQPYPAAWDLKAESMRVTLPNRHLDPKLAADLYHRYFDEWMLADDLGLDIMLNEHHATPTCISPSVNLPLAIVARQTKKARLLTLGEPIANRPDPVRVAEELSVIDVISRGRLEMGFVRGVPYELSPANSNPARMMERFWEAHDLIIKAMTTHDGPFRWEGEFFQARNVNIWPRPYQAPHPPVWVTSSSPRTIEQIARRGYVVATILTGWNTRKLYDHYRATWRQFHPGAAPDDRFAYCCFIALGDNEAEARRRAEILIGQLRVEPIAEPFLNPPGYLSVGDNVRALKGYGANPLRVVASPTKDGRTIYPLHDATVDDFVQAGLLFCGTPDQVYRQATEFVDHTGGVGNLLVQFQAGALGHEDTVSNLTMFAREVLPRLKEYQPKERAAA